MPCDLMPKVTAAVGCAYAVGKMRALTPTHNRARPNTHTQHTRHMNSHVASQKMGHSVGDERDPHGGRMSALKNETRHGHVNIRAHGGGGREARQANTYANTQTQTQNMLVP